MEHCQSEMTQHDDCRNEDVWGTTHFDTLATFLDAKNRGLPEARIQIAVANRYSDLLDLILDETLSASWEVCDIMPNRSARLTWADVSIGPGLSRRVLTEGAILAKCDHLRLVLDLRSNSGRFDTHQRVTVYCAEGDQDAAEEFRRVIEDKVKAKELYRGKFLQYDGQIKFLDCNQQAWADVAVPEEVRGLVTQYVECFLSGAKSDMPNSLWYDRLPVGVAYFVKTLIDTDSAVTRIVFDTNRPITQNSLNTLYELAGDLGPSVVIADFDGFESDGWRLVSVRDDVDIISRLLFALQGVDNWDKVFTIAQVGLGLYSEPGSVRDAYEFVLMKLTPNQDWKTLDSGFVGDIVDTYADGTSQPSVVFLMKHFEVGAIVLDH